MASRGPTKADVARIAREAVRRRKAGKTAWECNAVDFDLDAGGYCARFVRQCHDAALGRGEWAWAYAAPTAREMERKLRAAGLGTGDPQPGDIVGLNNQDYSAGHIAIYLGEIDGVTCIAENTSSSSRGEPRGAGTKISPLAAVAHEVTGYYAVLPPGQSAEGYAPGPVTVEVAGVGACEGWFTDHSIVGVANIARLLGYAVEDRVREERKVVLRGTTEE